MKRHKDITGISCNQRFANAPELDKMITGRILVDKRRALLCLKFKCSEKDVTFHGPGNSWNAS